MGTKGIKVFELEEICQFLNKEKADKEEREKFSREGFRCMGAAERGMGGLSRTAKFIPESIHILVTPQSCLLHCDFDLKMNGYTTGVYSLLLTEQEIVGGKVVNALEKCILQLLKELEPLPKVITITVSCIDGLIRSDYTGLKRKLKEEYGIRFGVVEMFPILAENKVKHTDKFMDTVFSLVETDAEKPKKKLVNIIGKIDVPDTTTDIYTVLKKAGYEVREIRQCQSLEDFDEMGEACMNLVLSEFSLYAAKKMEKNLHIPYIFWNESMSAEMLKDNYEELSRKLGCRLEIDDLYMEAKRKCEEVKKLAEGMTFAVGQRLDYIPIKAACELAEMGLTVKYVFVDKISKADLTYYERMREVSPETRIYLAPDISMKQFMYNPETVDVVLAGSPYLMKNVKGLLYMNLMEEPHDFTTLIQIMEQMKQKLTEHQNKQKNESGKLPEKTMFTRAWKSYPKGV